MKLGLFATVALVALTAGGNASAKPAAARLVANSATTGVVLVQTPVAKRAKPRKRLMHIPPVKPRWRGDFEHHGPLEAIKFVQGDVGPKAKAAGECGILHASDPDDDMAYKLWAAYVGSPRHATREAWERFDNQPVFFRMAAAALSICGVSVTSTVAGAK